MIGHLLPPLAGALAAGAGFAVADSLIKALLGRDARIRRARRRDARRVQAAHARRQARR